MTKTSIPLNILDGVPDCMACADELMRIEGEQGKELVLGDLRFFRMFLCPKCGNKRCPKASDHRLACSGSNEPGQTGSVYE